jgi:hypothetical protein
MAFGVYGAALVKEIRRCRRLLAIGARRLGMKGDAAILGATSWITVRRPDEREPALTIPDYEAFFADTPACWDMREDEAYAYYLECHPDAGMEETANTVRDPADARIRDAQARATPQERHALAARLDEYARAAMAPPALTDPLALWIASRVSTRLADAGIRTVADFVSRSVRSTRRPIANCPGIGPALGRRLVAWAEAVQGSRSAPRGAGDVAHLPKPLEHYAENAYPGIAEDRGALEEWLSTIANPDTRRKYRGYGEAFVLWMHLADASDLDRATADIVVRFGRFAEHPEQRPGWLGRRGAHRTDPTWAPFVAGVAGAARARIARRVANAFVNWRAQQTTGAPKLNFA